MHSLDTLTEAGDAARPASFHREKIFGSLQLMIVGNVSGWSIKSVHSLFRYFK